MPAQAGTQITSQLRCARRWNGARSCGGDLRGTWSVQPGDLGPRLRGGDGGEWGWRVPHHRSEIQADHPTLASFPRRREPRSLRNAGVRAAEISRAAAGVLRGRHGPRGPVTWAPAIVPEARLRRDAGVTVVSGAGECLTIAVKSKPIIQHWRHSREGGNPDHFATQVHVSLKCRAWLRRPWFDGLTTEDRSKRKGAFTMGVESAKRAYPRASRLGSYCAIPLHEGVAVRRRPGGEGGVQAGSRPRSQDPGVFRSRPVPSPGARKP